jgi:hypothetical protein
VEVTLDPVDAPPQPISTEHAAASGAADRELCVIDPPTHVVSFL